MTESEEPLLRDFCVLSFLNSARRERIDPDLNNRLAVALPATQEQHNTSHGVPREEPRSYHSATGSRRDVGFAKACGGSQSVRRRQKRQPGSPVPQALA